MEKFEKLNNILRELKSVVIAFSGGVDSTFLLKAAHDVLHDKAIAVTVRSCLYPKRELDEAVAFCKKEGITHIILDSDELQVEGFSQNPPNRCYLCKTDLFNKISAIAKERGILHIAEGSNTDDEGDYRPGMKAIIEQGIKSPLRDAGLSKQEIRSLSQKMGLPTWDKQPFACFASRIPYGDEINLERLNMIERAEQLLFDLGFKRFRVRCHGNLARIETGEDGFNLLTSASLREKIFVTFKEIGFKYIALDLQGYRTGSMNETLA